MDKTLIVRMIHVVFGFIIAAIPIALAFSGWSKLSAEQREPLGRPLRPLVGIASLLAVATGLYLMMLSLKDAAEVPGWHAWFGVKFLLAIVLMIFASAIVGKSDAFAKFRSSIGMKIGFVIAYAVILIALYLGHGNQV